MDLEKLKAVAPMAYEHRMGLGKACDDKAQVSILRAGHIKAGSSFTEDGTGIFRISGPKVDRMGDVVEPMGMDNTDYRRNPVMLWAHDDTKPPIGKSLSEEKMTDGVYSESAFDLKNDPQGFNRQVFGQYMDGVMNAVSIRFLPTKWDKIMSKVENGAEVWTGGFHFHEWTLLEYSAVPIPAYPEALALAAPAVMRMAKSMGVAAQPSFLDPLGVEAAARVLFKGLMNEDLIDVLVARLRSAESSGKPPAEPAGGGATTFSPDDAKASAEVWGLIESLKDLGARLRAA